MMAIIFPIFPALTPAPGLALRVVVFNTPSGVHRPEAGAIFDHRIVSNPI
jgi:hypothetical protein